MVDKAAAAPVAASRWREASERLRSTARVFVVSLGAVAVTVVAGLSLTGLSTLDPQSESFAFAVRGALIAILGVVLMLSLVMRLASASAVSMAELLAIRPTEKGFWWRRILRPGHSYALKVVDSEANGYLAGYGNLKEFGKAVAAVHKAERNKAIAAANAPDDVALFSSFMDASKKSAWYDARLRSLVEVASFQRLRWNFAATAALMTVVGSATAIGIVMYAAALQPRDVPTSPVAVTTHERILVMVPQNKSAAALYKSVLGCDQSVGALVTGVSEGTVSAITIPTASCRSVTLNAAWDGTNYTATFSLSGNTGKSAPDPAQKTT